MLCFYFSNTLIRGLLSKEQNEGILRRTRQLIVGTLFTIQR